MHRALVELLREIPFEDVLADVKDRLDYGPAEYLSRICIRFCLSSREPLLLRARFKYKPLTSAKFVRQTKRAWRDLAASTKRK